MENPNEKQLIFWMRHDDLKERLQSMVKEDDKKLLEEAFTAFTEAWNQLKNETEWVDKGEALTYEKYKDFYQLLLNK